MTDGSLPGASTPSSDLDRQARVERELEAHTDRDVLAENLRVQGRFPHIFGYPSRRRLLDLLDAAAAGAAGERLVPPTRWDDHMSFCGIFEAPAALLTSVLMPSRPKNPILRLADRAERWMHEHRFLLSWNQYVPFDLRKKAPPAPR